MLEKWERFTAKVRKFGVAITPSVEGLSAASLGRFKAEPALWIGAGVAIFVAVKDATTAGADEWTLATVAVVAFSRFVTRRHVSPSETEPE